MLTGTFHVLDIFAESASCGFSVLSPFCLHLLAPNEGELTDLRTALVSNINLAIVAVRLSIHRYLDQTDPTLWENIGSFAQVVLEQPYKLWQLEVWRLEFTLFWPL
nr:unnamed protein product [Spirometra erinaceieuropaei]